MNNKTFQSHKNQLQLFFLYHYFGYFRFTLMQILKCFYTVVFDSELRIQNTPETLDKLLHSLLLFNLITNNMEQEVVSERLTVY